MYGHRFLFYEDVSSIVKNAVSLSQSKTVFSRALSRRRTIFSSSFDESASAIRAPYADDFASNHFTSSSSVIRRFSTKRRDKLRTVKPLFSNVRTTDDASQLKSGFSVSPKNSSSADFIFASVSGCSWNRRDRQHDEIVEVDRVVQLQSLLVRFVERAVHIVCLSQFLLSEKRFAIL